MEGKEFGAGRRKGGVLARCWRRVQATAFGRDSGTHFHTDRPQNRFTRQKILATNFSPHSDPIPDGLVAKWVIS